MSNWVLLFALGGLLGGAVGFGGQGATAAIAQLAFFACAIGWMVSVVLASTGQERVRAEATEAARYRSVQLRL